jgi:hypothetical protein
VTAVIAPFLVASAVLCVAGVAKLRAPAGAVRALAAAGFVARPWMIRGFALAEIALGAWAALEPTRADAAALVALYLAFSGLSLVLARRRAACGCFGEGDAPASPLQALLSAALATIAMLAAASPPHGVAWLVGQQAWFAAIMLIAAGGAAYATVAAYTDLPLAWGAWSAR